MITSHSNCVNSYFSSAKRQVPFPILPVQDPFFVALHKRSRTQFNIQVNSKSFPFSWNLEQKPTNSGSASEQRLRPDIQRFHSTEPPFLESIDFTFGLPDWASGLCSLYRRIRYNEVCYIEVLFHTFYCNFGWDIEYRSLYRGLR